MPGRRRGREPVFELSGENAAEILDIPAPAYRKRLSRARERLREFMRGHCGLVNPDRPCRCERRIAHAISIGRVHPHALAYAGNRPRGGKSLDVARELGEMQELQRISGIYQSHPEYDAPERVLAEIRQILDTAKFSILR